MNKITVDELRHSLEELPAGATFVSVVQVTPADMNKTNNPFYGKVFKVAKLQGVLDGDYTKAVNRQRLREGKAADFVSQPRKWGQRVGDTCLIEHKGTYYLEVRVLRTLRSRLVDESGRFMAKSKVAAFLKAESGAPQQDLDKEIVIRTPKLENLRRIAIKGQRFEIVPNA